MPRFAILEHDSPRGVHWDFLLETGPVLTTWALAQPPDTPSPIEAESLADHRIEYLNYEGPISDGRGSVTRWDTGTYQFVRQSERELVISLEGEQLRGTVTLGRVGEDTRKWQFQSREE